MWEQINIVSVALIIPSIWLAAIVLTHWVPRAYDILKNRKLGLSGENWLILGITISFIGVILNTSFWGFHFMLEAIGQYDLEAQIYKLGPLFNIFTRHVPFIIAAYCHLMAHWTYQKEGNKHPRWHLYAAGIGGMVGLVLLEFIKFIVM